MSCNWEMIPLGELITLQRGHDLPSSQRTEGSIPIMGSSGITGFHNKAKCVGEGVTVGRSGNSMGEVSFIAEDYWPLNTCLYVTDFKSNDPKYVYYLLKTINFDQFNSGSAQKSLNRNAVYPFEVHATRNKEVQKEIGSTLSRLEKKVTLNIQTNQTLEQMAQAIFKSWFVDFDPVKAKMRGEQPEGMDEATASLFPEKLVESELGLIPEGWSIQTIKTLSEKISKGTTPSKKDLASATDTPSIRFIKVKDINDQGEILRDKLETIPDSIHTSKLKRSILEKEDILFSIAGTIGRVAIVDQDLDNVNTNQAVAFVRLKDKKTYLPLVYMAMRESRLQQKAISSIVQGVQANLSLANVGDMEVIVPSEDILNLWNAQYSSMLQMIKSNFTQSRQLASLRDTLLPKLLSGEIELGEHGN